MSINMIMLLLVLASLNNVDSVRNNACRSFLDYWSWPINKHCFYNADMSLEPPEIIKKYAGTSETHYVTTEDGYILTMFRMPRENPKDVILLHHPLTSDSRIWIGQGDDSLAFYLWQAGYDIWIANDRGTEYSQRHETLSARDFQFWNYTFHEIGLYDVPSQIKLIKEKTNNVKIIYIGHSQGTSAGLVYSSLKPQEAENSIKLFVFMATPCFFTHERSLLKLVNPFDQLIQKVTKTFKIGSALSLLPGILQISKFLFRAFPGALYVLNLLLYAILGWTPKGSNPAILNLDCGVYLKDFSWKLFLHYRQLSIAQTKFQYFDYGRRKNLRYYGSERPPLYPLENMRTPIFFVSSHEDALTSLQGTDLLIQTIQNTTKVYGHLKVSGIDHMGYHFGWNRKEVYIDKLLEFLSTI